MTIEDDNPYEPGSPMDLEQARELAKLLSTVSVYRTKRDNEFAQDLTELANKMHPEPGEALLKQTQIWITEISKLLSGQSAEVSRILGLPDQADEPKGMLQ
ncbi:hypothetical protein [Rhodopseudomonas palustris]